MSRPKLGFRNKPAREQILICERVIADLKRAPQKDFQTLRVAELTQKVAAIRASHERINHLKADLKAETGRRNELLRKVRPLLTASYAYHAGRLGREAHQLLAAGIEVEVSKRRSVGPPAKPTNVRAVPASHSTDITLRWERAVRRCMFQVEARRDGQPDTEWRIVHQGFKIKAVISGLNSGGLYWFRLRAINAHGAGPWSNPVSARVR